MQADNPAAITEAVVDIVERLTGYPRDLLDVDLDLEADLGVDTVKQAEVFAAVREQFGIPRDDNMKLREFPTLAHVIGFVRDKTLEIAESLAAVEAAAAPAPSAAQEQDPVAEAVVDIVERLTGYPRDLLDVDLDLEADLGVDTVKQAEVFAAVREQFGIPRDDNMKLREFPTLAHVIGFVRDKTSGAEPRPPAPDPATAPAGPDELGLDFVSAEIVQIVADMTGYPPELLDTDLDLEADLGVDTVKQAEVFAAVRDRFGIPRDDNLKLREFPTLAHVIAFARDRGRPAAPAAESTARHPPSRPAAGRAAPAEPAAAAAPAAGPADLEEITAQIVQIVADMTGYPPELLDTDLDLEADLGVDTVKQAEVFAAVRAQFGIPRDDNMKLREFPTLAHVIAFARDRGQGAAPAAAQPQAAAPAAPAPAAPAQPRRHSRLPRRLPRRLPAEPAAAAAPAAGPADLGEITAQIVQIVADMTGYPPELLDTDLDLEADLGVDTVKQAEVFAAVREQFGIPRDDNMKLREFPTLAHVIAFARDRGQGAAPAAAQPQAAAPAAAAVPAAAAAPATPAPAAPAPAAPARRPHSLLPRLPRRSLRRLRHPRPGLPTWKRSPPRSCRSSRT